MKKLLMGLFLVTTLIAVADDQYDYIEDKLELKYSILTDSKKNTLNIDGIDMGVFNGHAFVKMEIEAFSGDGGWEKFDKASYNKIAKEIADDVRAMLNSNNPVEVTLIVEREVGKDAMLHSANY